MKNINDKIVEYLGTHGKVSDRDICGDLEISEADVCWAEQNDHRITRCDPPVYDGVGTWYCIS